ncbi:Uncharacterized protein FWK35_00016527 [Aphis craccivora]|uniref:Uncharacterized protein n=1 Tax=Aphis craccivora TaxID=307492 RepID=A0A6G0ZI84_APHCR|nr:Uncharacterized protein FWK35_00016527 [Aphis craccivora]
MLGVGTLCITLIRVGVQSRTYLMVLTDGGLSGTDDDDDDDELVASMRAFRHTRTESGATLATHYSAVRQCSSGGQQ